MIHQALWSLALATYSTASWAGSCAPPSQWAAQFYSAHRAFYTAPPKSLSGVVTPEFQALLLKDWTSSSQHSEIGALGYEPWSGAQDGDIGQPTIQTEMESDDLSIVSMSFPFRLNGSETRSVAHLVLSKAAGQCWKLQDFLTPLGESLSYLYSSASN